MPHCSLVDPLIAAWHLGRLTAALLLGIPGLLAPQFASSGIVRPVSAPVELIAHHVNSPQSSLALAWAQVVSVVLLPSENVVEDPSPLVDLFPSLPAAVHGVRVPRAAKDVDNLCGKVWKGLLPNLFSAPDVEKRLPVKPLYIGAKVRIYAMIVEIDVYGQLLEA